MTNKSNPKVLSLVGLATRAGKTVSGEFSTEKSVKSGKGYLVLVAGDASENTRKKFRNWENTAERNSVQALPCRMKILQKRY